MSAAKKQEAKKESLEDILNAIKEKEDVLKPLPEELQKKKEKKEKQLAKSQPAPAVKPNEIELHKPEAMAKALREIHDIVVNPNLIKMARYFSSPIKYMLLKFCAGIFLGIRFVAAIIAAFHLLILFRDIAFIDSMFDKMIILMRSMIN